METWRSSNGGGDASSSSSETRGGREGNGRNCRESFRPYGLIADSAKSPQERCKKKDRMICLPLMREKENAIGRRPQQDQKILKIDDS